MIRLPLLAVVVGLTLLATVYVFGMAYWQAATQPYYSVDDLIAPRLIDVVVLGWCFWIGSSIGSFLNVVAWRMPRGETVGGRSHCPRCWSQLRARDNFPVLGWLALGGRCRTCRLPISARYPIVEFVVGTSLSAIAIGQLYRLSLPNQSTHWHGGPLWAPLIDRSVLLVLVFHVFAVAGAWAMGLIRLDRHALPNRLIQIGLGPVVLAMIVYPPLGVIGWQAGDAASDTSWTGGSYYVDAIVRVVFSLAAAALIGRSLAKAFCPAADPKLDPLGKSTRRLIDLIAIVTLPSLIVGWQSVAAVAVVGSWIAIVLRRLLHAAPDALGSFALAVPVSLTIHLCLWRWLSDQFWWPHIDSSPWTILAWAGAVLLVPIWLRDREPESFSPPEIAEDDLDE